MSSQRHLEKLTHPNPIARYVSWAPEGGFSRRQVEGHLSFWMACPMEPILSPLSVHAVPLKPSATSQPLHKPSLPRRPSRLPGGGSTSGLLGSFFIVHVDFPPRGTPQPHAIWRSMASNRIWLKRLLVEKYFCFIVSIPSNHEGCAGDDFGAHVWA